MGPEFADGLRDLLTTDPSLLKQLALNATKAAATHDADTSGLLQILQSMQQSVAGEKAAAFKRQLKQTERTLTAIGGNTGNAANRLKTAHDQFTESIDFICDKIKRLTKSEKKINKLNKKIADLCDSSSDDTDDSDSDSELSDSMTEKDSDDFDDNTAKTEYRRKQSSQKTKHDKHRQTKNKAKRTKAKEDAEFLETLQHKRTQYITEKKTYQQNIFEHFDETLGGMSTASKYHKHDLCLPTNMNKTTERTITNAFKTFLSHRASEYYAIMPYIFYIIDSYNPKTGRYYEPPSKKKDYYGVDPDLMTAYTKQAELSYREILACIKQTDMTLITQ